jgi:hypothetical protein
VLERKDKEEMNEKWQETKEKKRAEREQGVIKDKNKGYVSIKTKIICK